MFQDFLEIATKMKNVKNEKMLSGQVVHAGPRRAAEVLVGALGGPRKSSEVLGASIQENTDLPEFLDFLDFRMDLCEF